MAQMTEHRINSEVKIGVLKWPIFFSFQCCLTWLLAYPVLAVLTFMVLPFHYRYKVSTTERISVERKYLLLSLLFFFYERVWIQWGFFQSKTRRIQKSTIQHSLPMRNKLPYFCFHHFRLLHGAYWLHSPYQSYYYTDCSYQGVYTGKYLPLLLAPSLSAWTEDMAQRLTTRILGLLEYTNILP